MKFIKLFFVLNGFFSLLGCNNRIQPSDPTPKYDTFTIESKQLGEKRIINVWTPDRYSIDTSSRLPILYMLDGGIKEDFPHIANTISDLIAKNRIQPVILVGIENTQRRRDLTGFTSITEDKKIAPLVGGSKIFRSFVKDELFTEVQKRYKSNGNRGIIGESLAGLFVVETLMLDPLMFNFYIAFDPSLWWNDKYLVNNAKDYLLSIPASTNVQFWFAGSNAVDIAPSTQELSTILKSLNLSNIKWNYSDEPKEKHSTIFRSTKEKALIWTLGY